MEIFVSSYFSGEHLCWAILFSGEQLCLDILFRVNICVQLFWWSSPPNFGMNFYPVILFIDECMCPTFFLFSCKCFYIVVSICGQLDFIWSYLCPACFYLVVFVFSLFLFSCKYLWTGILVVFIFNYYNFNNVHIMFPSWCLQR